jgi:2-dehydro-3-deoxyphosphogluconate aldolase/(4S)-4-hydroxy-2-oxoglutarate aldolase
MPLTPTSGEGRTTLDLAGIVAVESAPVVPVIVIDDASHAAPLGRALVQGGIRFAEVTLRTPAALASLREMSSVDGLIVGAGTVLDVEGVERAVAAGARFIVSPGLDESVVLRCLDLGVLPIPGIATASEIQRALALGLKFVKAFPAAPLGGPAFLETMSAPFPQMSFLPSGGVDLASAPAYLALPAVPVVSGSWMAPRSAIAAGDFATITRLAQETTSALASGSR